MERQIPFTFSGLTCAFGEPWEGAHPLCEQEVERACQRFNEAVARGECNERGYTPREWAAKVKRDRLRG